MKAFLAALAAVVVLAIAAGVVLDASKQSTREAFQSTSGSVRLDS
jgi:hypothetical protein